MPQDSIFDMVNNVEPLYLDLQGLYRKWTRELDDNLWSRTQALKEARLLAAHFAEAIESMPHVQGKYGPNDFRAAADEMLEEWEAENKPDDKPSMGAGAKKKDLEMVKAHRNFMQLGTHAWFDFLNSYAKRLGPEKFEAWLLEEVTPWSHRAQAISLMAWNDRNSTWSLDYKRIMETKKIEDEDVTPEMVVESLMTMVHPEDAEDA